MARNLHLWPKPHISSPVRLTMRGKIMRIRVHSRSQYISLNFGLTLCVLIIEPPGLLGRPVLNPWEASVVREHACFRVLSLITISGSSTSPRIPQCYSRALWHVRPMYASPDPFYRVLHLHIAFLACAL